MIKFINKELGTSSDKSDEQTSDEEWIKTKYCDCVSSDQYFEWKAAMQKIFIVLKWFEVI